MNSSGYVKDPGDGNELARKNEDRSNPQKHGNGGADGNAVPQLEIISYRSKIMLRRDTPYGRSDPECENERTDSGREYPPDCGNAIAIAKARRTDGGTSADVRGEHGTEQQPRTECAASNEEIAGGANATRYPRAQRKLGNGVREEPQEW